MKYESHGIVPLVSSGQFWLKNSMNLQNNRNILFQASRPWPTLMKVLVFVTAFPMFVLGQELTPVISRDTTPAPIQRDSNPQTIDPAYESQAAFLYSKDSLDAPVDYNAVDSMIYDIRNQQIHLYGDATVQYTDINLEADYIIFDWNSNIVTAEGMPDSTGRMAGFPKFDDGSQSFTAKKMRYNFKTRKGIVYDVTTQQNDVYVLGTQSKFISEPTQDTTQERNDVVYSKDAIFTTCTHPEPHFGIRSNKQKVIPNKLVVVGASNLEIMGVPTPVWLPFGFFPISGGRQTGLIFPSDYEYSPQLGFGLREVGWFFPLGDHFNLTLTGDYYLRGTWRAHARSQYRKRYKYSGNLSLDFANQLQEQLLDRETGAYGFVPNRSLSLRWSHQQAAQAHPTRKFGGSVSIQTNNYQSIVNNDANSVLNNQLSSNLTFSQNWRDLPFNLSASFNHNQNTATRKVSVTFPNVQFRTQTLYPFRNKKRGNRGKWSDNVTLRYTNDIQNRFEATDTTLFEQETLDDAQFGIRHNVTSGTSFKVLKYFNLNPSFNYREVWYLNTNQQFYREMIAVDSSLVANSDSTDFQLVYDTTRTFMLDELRQNGFDRFYQMSASLNLNTQIFGTLRFKKGPLLGLRHVVKPTVGLSFAPNYTDPSLGWFYDLENPNSGFDQSFSIFRGGVFGEPSRAERQMALTYSINNIFEAKVFSKRDSTDKNIKLFNNITVNGNYNFAADTLKWSPVSIGGTARFF